MPFMTSHRTLQKCVFLHWLCDVRTKLKKNNIFLLFLLTDGDRHTVKRELYTIRELELTACHIGFDCKQQRTPADNANVQAGCVDSVTFHA